MTDKQLHELFRAWQAKLNLSHWFLTLSIDHLMPQAGVTESMWEYLEATITINPTYIREKKVQFDEELVIVHELCHVMLASLWTDADELTEHERMLHERTVEELSRTLLDIVGTLRYAG